MGKHIVLKEIDNTYDITIMQYSNKGIVFILTDKITGKEVDRFMWAYPLSKTFRGGKGDIRRFASTEKAKEVIGL